MTFQSTQIDTFAGEKFQGNPTMVWHLPRQIENDLMFNLARECSLSESAFLLGQKKALSLRCYTPYAEIDVGVNAVLASAHLAWELGLANEPVSFQVLDGAITAAKSGNVITMRGFSSIPEHPVEPPEDLITALGVIPKYVGKTSLYNHVKPPKHFFRTIVPYGDELISEMLRLVYLVEVDSEEVLANLTPNFLALSDIHAAGFIVTSSSESQEQDFVYRYFAPLVGIKEDHVTGSACRCLAAFWSKRLHKANLQAFQASSRGAAITMTLEEEKLEIQGQAISVAKVNWL